MLDNGFNEDKFMLQTRLEAERDLLQRRLDVAMEGLEGIRDKAHTKMITTEVYHARVHKCAVVIAMETIAKVEALT